MDEEYGARVGTFFIVMGGGSMMLFIVSDIANDIMFNYFFMGLLAIVLGIYLRRNAMGAEASGRFETYKKWRSGKLKVEMAEKRKAQEEARASKREARKAEAAEKRQKRKERFVGSIKSIGKRKKEEQEE